VYNCRKFGDFAGVYFKLSTIVIVFVNFLVVIIHLCIDGDGELLILVGRGGGGVLK
jgi:hypothetical protein